MKQPTGDLGSVALKHHHAVVFEARERSSTGQVTVAGCRVTDQTAIDRYFLRGLLDREPEVNMAYRDAADRLRGDFYLSGLQLKGVSSFEPRVGQGCTDRAAALHVDALKRYKDAMGAVGRRLSDVLYWVVLQDMTAGDWATKHGKNKDAGIEILRLALAELTDHYGLL